MVEFLPGASAALIESIPGQVHDVEGVHDRPCIGEFFGGCTLKPGESIHCDDLDAAAPRVRLGSQPGFEDPLGSAQDHVQEPGGTAAIVDGHHIQDDGDVFVAVWGVAPHVFIHANDTHPLETCWIIDQQTRPIGQDSSISGIPGHAQGLGDARHRQVVDYQARQRSAHRCARELGAWLGCLAHVLAPHVSTRLGAGSGARSHARSWGATRRAHAPSA